jgi:hypothetical protein
MRNEYLSHIAAALAGSILIAQALHAAEPVGQIRGIVKNEQRAPLPSVKVQMCGFETLADGTWRRELRTGLMPSCTTDDEGRFIIPVQDPSMRYDFFCDKPGYAPAFLYAITNNSPELTVVLQRGLTVTGTVRRLVNGKPEPVTGSQVELRLPYVDLWYQQRTMTDPNGQYKFQVTPIPNRKWQVVFAGEVVPLDIEEGQPVHGPDFEISVSVSGSTLQPPASTALAAETTYDLNRDWSDTQNPNGAWSYCQSNSPISVFQKFWWGQSGWGYHTIGDGCIIKGSYFAGLTDPSGNVIAPAFDWQPGDVMLHALSRPYGGETTCVNVKWTSPGDGFINISGRAWDGEIFADRDVAWMLIVAGQTVAQRKSTIGVHRNDSAAQFVSNLVENQSLKNIRVRKAMSSNSASSRLPTTANLSA